MKTIGTIFLFFVLGFAPSCWGQESFNIYTLEYPPYAFGDKDGKISGLATEIIRELLRRLNVADNISLLPWKRGYTNLQNDRNVLLYPITRSADRDPLFKWVGPIGNSKLVLLALRDAKISVNSLEDAKKVGGIGTVLGFHQEKLLLDNGFTNVQSIPGNDSQNALKLKNGRIDLWAVDEIIGNYEAKTQGIDPISFKIAYTVEDVSTYMALSKEISDEIVRKWQRALDEIKSDGTFDKIKDKWAK